MESRGAAAAGTGKPDVVLYEESLDQEVLSRSVEYITRADMLIVGGTSLTVYPAAGLIDYYRGNRMVLINKTVTPMDSRADLVISGAAGRYWGSGGRVSVVRSADCRRPEPEKE